MSDLIAATFLSPDGVAGPFAIETLYVDVRPDASPDHQPLLQFQPEALERTVRLGRDFEALFPDASLRFFTNSLDLVRYYAPKLKAAGVSKFTFTIIPAVWSGS